MLRASAIPYPARAAASARAALRFDSALASWGLDIVVVNLAFLLAYADRYHLGLPTPLSPFDYRPLADFWPIQLTLTLIAAIVLPATGLYRQVRSVAPQATLSKVFGGATVVYCLLIVLGYLSRLYADSRGLYIIGWGLTIGLLVLAKAVGCGLRATLYKRGIGVDGLIVVGGTEMAARVMQRISASPSLGYRLLGFLDDRAEHDGLRAFPHLGRMDQLAGVVAASGAREVIIALPTHSYQKVLESVNRCLEQNVRYRIVPDVFEMSWSPVHLEDIAGIPLIGFREPRARAAVSLLRSLGRSARRRRAAVPG
jgi:FlaA1/EpsC-like NDP-sugar epimerase